MFLTVGTQFIVTKVRRTTFLTIFEFPRVLNTSANKGGHACIGSTILLKHSMLHEYTISRYLNRHNIKEGIRHQIFNMVNFNQQKTRLLVR